MTTNFIYDGTGFSNQPKTDLVPIGATDPTKAIQAVDWNTVVQAALDIQTFLRGGLKLYKTGDASKHCDVVTLNGDPNGVVTADKGSLCVDITNVRLYQNTTGSTVWTLVGGTAQKMFDVAFGTTSFVNAGFENNVNFGALGLVSFCPFSSTVNEHITGISNNGVAMAAGDDGRVICVLNVGSQNCFVDVESGNSTATNRVSDTLGHAQTTIVLGFAAWFRYNGSTLRWVQISGAIS